MPEPQLFSDDGHLEATAFVLLADGELLSYNAELAHAHLRQCWTCRAEYSRVSETMERVARFREQTLLPLVDVPPGLPPKLQARLLATTTPQNSWFPRLFRRALPVLAALLLLVVWRLSRPNPTELSPDTYLQQALDAEYAEEAALGSRVLHQNFRVVASERGSGQQTQLAYAVWRGRLSSRVTVSGTNLTTANRLNRLYEANQLDFKRPVSARELQSLRRNRPNWAITSGVASQDARYVRLESPDIRAARGDLVAATLTMHTKDWRPYASEYVFPEVTIQIEETHRDYVDEAIIAGSDRASPSHQHPHAIAREAADLERVADPDPEFTELAVRLAIRELGIGVDEPVSVGRNQAGEVVVEALNVTPTRLQQLTELHHRFPYLLLDSDGSQLAQSLTPCTECNAPARHIVAQFDSPRYRLIEERLGASRLRELSAAAVKSVELAQAHSLALVQLAERYPTKSEVQLPVEAQRILRKLVLGGASDLEAALQKAESQLLPILELLPDIPVETADPRGKASWREAVAAIHQRMVILDREVKGLLTSSNTQVDQFQELSARRLRAAKSLVSECLYLASLP